MERPLRRLTPLVLLLAGGAQVSTDTPQTWQADIQIRTLEITRAKNSLNARVVVYTENDDDAQNARLLILLPVGVSIERLESACVATRGPSIVPSPRAPIRCAAVLICNRACRAVLLSTTAPATPQPRRFGVFAYSATPDPVPGN